MTTMTNNQLSEDPDLILSVGGGSRPPSYKLDSHIDLDALERDLQHSVQLHHEKVGWRQQFHGTPLVFWLVLFVLIGIVSLFIPPQTFLVTLSLWLPLFLYLVGLFLFHVTYRKKVHHSLQEMECQLAAIHQRRQRVLTQTSEYPADLYFLYATSDQYTVTTLLPPPPSYQRS